MAIYFQEGTHVKQGDLLAKINDKPLQAELKKLEAQIPLAKDRVYRQHTLLEKDAVSQEAYEQVATEYEKLMADTSWSRPISPRQNCGRRSTVLSVFVMSAKEHTLPLRPLSPN